MKMIFVCPKCATTSSGEPNTVKICKHCNIERIETDVKSMDFYADRSKKQYIREKYVYNNPLYDPEVEKRVEKETSDSIYSIIPPSMTQPNVPKCPICQSTNLSKITLTKKAVKIGLFGIFGMGDNGKTWKCNNCGSKF